MTRNKFASLAFAGIIGLNTTMATTIDARGDTREGRVEARTEVRGEVKTNLRERFEGGLRKFFNQRGSILNGKVTAKTENSLTVESEGKSIKVNVTSDTHFKRKFWGGSSLAEIAIGNNVNVIGRWANEEKTEINAVLIRDLSIQKRFAVFVGTVLGITDSGFTLDVVKRDDQTVTVGNAKIVNRREETITKSEIKVGDRVRVKGMWDSSSNTITEVTHIKDFSLPVKPSPTPESQ